MYMEIYQIKMAFLNNNKKNSYGYSNNHVLVIACFEKFLKPD